jgi:hypothetical protein
MANADIISPLFTKYQDKRPVGRPGHRWKMIHR